MELFTHHYNTSTYEHSMHVAYFSFLLCKKLHLDYKSSARAGMLHDFFLYDWHDHNRLPECHATYHPKLALKNAEKYFNLNDVEKDIILKHMWPITLVPPKYKESFIITITDKISTLMEAFAFYKEDLRIKKLQRMAYTFFMRFLLPI